MFLRELDSWVRSAPAIGHMRNVLRFLFFFFFFLEGATFHPGLSTEDSRFGCGFAGFGSESG